MRCLCFGSKAAEDVSHRVSSVLAPSLAAIIPKIEAEWEQLRSKTGSSGLDAADLLEVWRRADGARWKPEDAELIGIELNRIFSMLDFDGNGRISLNEFRHFVLLKAALPLQVQYLVDLAQRRAKTDKRFVDRLVSDFIEADAGMTGEITVAALEQILARRTETAVTCLAHVEAEGGVSYPEYLGLMLGRKPEKVTLLVYDISGKTMKVFGRILFGKKLEGIWHTSILAFGKEWWYGGDLFRSTPYKTPFGEPVKRVEIGRTYFTHQELFTHIADKLHEKFNQKTYDVFDNNCNNYSNTLAVFLCGRKIAQEILDMPRDLMAGGVARIFRRPLNRWLGGFGAASESDEEALEVVLKALAADRKLFRWRDKTVEVIEARGDRVDIRFIKQGAFEEVKDVPVHKLVEIEEMIDQDFRYLASVAIDDADVRQDLLHSDDVKFKATKNRDSVKFADEAIIDPSLLRVIFTDHSGSSRPPQKKLKTKCCS